jgi:hypothetical protein
MVSTSRLAAMLLLGVLTFPFTSEGQPPSPLPRVGVLRFTSPPPLDPFQQPFRDGLRRLGYVEGKNILVEYRWADGKAERAFSAMRKDGVGAVIGQPIFIGHRRRIAALAREHHLPSRSDYREFAEAGGLTRSSRARGPAICRSSSPPRSSSSSTARPRRPSTSRCRPRSCCAPIT